ncbi:cysteine hydrolase family protein [Zhouia sp. PK063]|uniref:cysteine hydrolase family protein n=1 Tax=Zhouia sp. PK063 TaxID=3373602 RepID=UPI0037876CB9
MKQTNNAALLIMDMQSSILQRIENASPLLENVNQAIKKAKVNQIPVIYVAVGFRADAPEISVNNKSFYTIASQINWTTEFADSWLQLHPDLEVDEHALKIVKRRVSAFTGSDLEVLLRGLNTNHIILTGVATSGVVLSTLREAADKDFQISVIEDCCVDPDPEVHKILITKVFPKQAEVLSLASWDN